MSSDLLYINYYFYLDLFFFIPGLDLPDTCLQKVIFLYLHFSEQFCVGGMAEMSTVLFSLAGKTFQLYSHNLIALFEQAKKTGLAAHIQTHRFPDKILPRYKPFTYRQLLISENSHKLCWCVKDPIICY